jgi:L-iditol 2-dehydrogenase
VHLHRIEAVHKLTLAQIDLLFSMKYRDTWPAAIAALSAGNINLDAMVTHKSPLEKAVEAMNTFADPSTGAVKVHIIDED